MNNASFASSTFSAGDPHSRAGRFASTMVFLAASITLAGLVLLASYGILHHRTQFVWTLAGFVLALASWIAWFQEHNPLLFGNRRSIADGSGTSASLLLHNFGHDTFEDASTQLLGHQTALLDFALDAIIIRDNDHALLYWNKAAEHLFGWNREEAQDMGMSEFFPETELDRFDGALAAFQEHGSWEGELVHSSKSGDRLVVQARWSLIRDGGCKPKGWLMVLRDLTEQRALESRLRRAQRLESLGTLAGGIAHDLNNILTPILLAAEILVKSNLDQNSKAILSTLFSAAERGKNIVKQVLTFARGAEEHYSLQNVDELARGMVSLVKGVFPKHVQITADISSVLPVYGDATQIDQVIMNLCVNARDAMPDGGTLTIAVSNLTVDETYTKLEGGILPGTYVVLSISDTGSGISPELRAKIFEPFFTTKDVGKGTGLGLSSVQAIVKAHKGFITLYSELGRGTQFRVYLPAIQQVRETESTDEFPALVSGNGETVLIIDDEQAVLQISKEMLEASGYSVLTARDSTDAITTCSEVAPGTIRLVICDLNMPGMGGAATVRSLREIDPKLNVVIASGSLTEVDLSLLQPLQVQGYLTKPFTAMQFLTVVYAAIHARDAA